MAPQSAEEVLMETKILKLFNQKMPKRPTIEEVCAAKRLIENIENDKQLKLTEITDQEKPNGVPDELFNVYVEMQKAFVCSEFESKKRDATKIIEVDRAHKLFAILSDEHFSQFHGSMAYVLTNLMESLGDNSANGWTSWMSEIKLTPESADKFFENFASTLSTLGILYHVDTKTPWAKDRLEVAKDRLEVDYFKNLGLLIVLSTIFTFLRSVFISCVKWCAESHEGRSSGWRNWFRRPLRQPAPADPGAMV